MRLTFCAVCGSTESLEHHHFEPLELGGLDAETNLLTLCSVHHGQIHGMRRAGNHKELTKSGLARVAWLGLGSPNPHAGGEANRLRWARIRAAKRAICLEVGEGLSSKETAAALNAKEVLTPAGGSVWTEDTVNDLWRKK
jgi:HNH endonuclease